MKEKPPEDKTQLRIYIKGQPKDLREGVDYELNRQAGTIRFIGDVAKEISVSADFSKFSDEDMQLLKDYRLDHSRD